METTKQTFIAKPAVVMLLVILLLAACSAPPAEVTPTASPTARPTLAPTATVAPTRTPAPSPTSTLALTPTLATNFTNAQLYTAGYLPDYRFFFALELPDPVKGDYYAFVDENKEYSCTIPAKHPNRLYCSGPLTKIDGWVSYTIFSSEANIEVFHGRLYAPYKLPR